MEKIALTLPGGGARAAYQAGVLKAISDTCRFKECPFQIISGISAGGINGMWLATGAKDFARSSTVLWELWKKLSVDQVFKTDALTLLQTGTTWARNLSLGEWFGKSHITYLLDTSPLNKLLTKEIDFNAIEENLQSGLLHGLSLSATDYYSGKAVTFFSGDKEIQPWNHTLTLGRRSTLGVEHVMASAAIPIFFPPVQIEGRDYGDGGIGLKTPLSPAVHLGANRILVIGVQNPEISEGADDYSKTIPRATIGDVSGALLNSLFLNSLDADIDRLHLLNRTAALLTKDQRRADIDHLREIKTLVIRPSRDLSYLGAQEFNHLPFAIRHVLKGVGLSNEKGWDLLSYLAFDQAYSAALLDLGYSDGLALQAEIADFFSV